MRVNDPCLASPDLLIDLHSFQKACIYLGRPSELSYVIYTAARYLDVNSHSI